MQDFPPIPSLVPQIFTTPSSSTHLQPPPPPQPLKCPRCDSINTKFCYYNNYNLSQPRHFCKACRRYWTKGGVLRNVPVGGGCRKNSNKKATKSKPAKPKPVSGSSSESSLTTLTANPEPVLELDTTTPHQVLFSDSGFGLSDPGLMVGDPEPEKVNGLDWGGSLFDMTVDPAGVYWNNNQTHWVDTDSTLFLP